MYGPIASAVGAEGDGHIPSTLRTVHVPYYLPDDLCYTVLSARPTVKTGLHTNELDQGARGLLSLTVYAVKLVINTNGHSPTLANSTPTCITSF